MDQDFYIEETNPLKIAFTIIFFIGLIGFGVYSYFHYYKANAISLKTVTIELGKPVSKNISDYIEGNNIDKYTLDVSSISVDENNNTNSTGEYSYKIKSSEKELKGKVFVKDTTKPIVEVNDLTVGVNESFNPNEFLTKCDDLSLPCKVKYKKPSDEKLNDKEGTYTIKIVISDSAGNEVTKDVNLIVSKDNSLENIKSKELTYDHNSANDISWNQTYTLKLETALNPDESAYEKALSEISSKEYSFDKSVKNKEILIIYNKYEYAIGFSIKYTFEDETVLYVTNDNATEIVSEEVTTNN